MTPGGYDHHMGVKDGGNIAILAGVGPMIGAIVMPFIMKRKPKLLVCN